MSSPLTSSLPITPPIAEVWSLCDKEPALWGPWEKVTEKLPDLLDAGDGVLSSGPVLGYMSDGSRRVLVLKKYFDENDPPDWYTQCSEGWNMTATIRYWTHLPGSPEVLQLSSPPVTLVPESSSNLVLAAPVPSSLSKRAPYPFSNKQWWKMCDVNMGIPVSLRMADLTRPFVYDRTYGVFYCSPGMHQAAMSLLLAFQHGFEDGVDIAERLLLEYSSGTANYWLETTPGAAFRSSVGKMVKSGKHGNLSVIERRLLGDVEYLF